VISHGNRDAISAIRATLLGNHAKLQNEVSGHINTTLLVHADSVDCIRRAYESDIFPENSPAAVGAYPEPTQFASGNGGELNELYPSGDVCEPERGLDILWWPPLLWAARNHDAETCRILLALGADPNYISPAGMTAVLAAVRGAALVVPLQRQLL
jgi:hypothetical protein